MRMPNIVLAREAIARAPGQTTADYATATGIRYDTLKRVLRRLHARGVVEGVRENWAEHDGRCGPPRLRWRVTHRDTTGAR